jgi:hypothetical protein
VYDENPSHNITSAFFATIGTSQTEPGLQRLFRLLTLLQAGLDVGLQVGGNREKRWRFGPAVVAARSGLTDTTNPGPLFFFIERTETNGITEKIGSRADHPV